ncbi:replication initiation protein [Planococcus beijingensis]|uniref:replication initiation protein n=1 Tax=Planococcus beijingensis TaxID=2782551 RepID=UPI00193B38E6|nr:replication initiation protein [Planococcus beijingensis]
MRKNLKTQLISHENSIRKSNELSMAKLNQGLTLNQMQLLAFSIFCTQQNGITEFHKVDFEKKFGIQKYKTEDARKDSDKVTSVKFGHWDPEKDYFDFWNVFRGMRYHAGVFHFTWTEEMIPHILELKDKYITTDLNIASKFKSSFSWTLYDYLKAHHGYWHKLISKEDLMRLFGVEKIKTYVDNTAQFKRGVLDVAIAEINKHTELEIRYNVEKEGRAISGFDLIWSNGKKVTSATKKQIKEIQGLIDIVFDDMFQYVNIDDKEDRQQAINLIQEIETMREFTDEPIAITSEKANCLIQKAVWDFRELNRLLEKNHHSISTESRKKVKFYNWLEDRT